MFGRKMTLTIKMIKRIAVYGGFVQLLLLLLVLCSCNFGTPDYKLNVTLEEGVMGTPQAGEHSYRDLSDVSFEYAAIDPIYTVEVFLNNIRQTHTGTFTMYTDVDLLARLVNIRGRWNMEMRQTDPTEIFKFDITFNGTSLTNGTFSDSRSRNGTWTAENGVVTIIYTDWGGYILSGTVFNMSGTFAIDGENKGVWSADRLN